MAIEQAVGAGGYARRRSAREAVAEEVRVAMARRRVSGSALARLLQKEQTWVSRRLRGVVAFDIDDLEQIARVLDYRLSLPHLDSNQKPTVSRREATPVAAVLPFRPRRPATV